jgi:hypothetical protein
VEIVVGITVNGWRLRSDLHDGNVCWWSWRFGHQVRNLTMVQQEHVVLEAEEDVLNIEQGYTWMCWWSRGN